MAFPVRMAICAGVLKDVQRRVFQHLFSSKEVSTAETGRASKKKNHFKCSVKNFNLMELEVN